jgi:hypothetical protein
MDVQEQKIRFSQSQLSEARDRLAATSCGDVVFLREEQLKEDRVIKLTFLIGIMKLGQQPLSLLPVMILQPFP